MIFINNVLFDELLPGDIIWAKRYTSELEKKNIESGHEIGPYIVIKKTSKNLYAIMCTSSNNNLTNYLKVEVEFDNPLFYNKEKISFINFNYIEDIKSERFIYKLGEINKNEFNKIKKILFLLSEYSHSKEKIKFLKKSDLKFTFSSGDIISLDEKLYFINDVKGRYYECHEAFVKGKDSDKLNIVKGFFNTFFTISNTFKTFDTNKDFNLVNIINSTDTLKIKNIEYLKEFYKKESRKVGVKTKVLRKNDQKIFLLLYKTEDNFNYYGIELFHSRLYDGKLPLINIDKGWNYTDFNIQEINRNDDLAFKVKVNDNDFEKILEKLKNTSQDDINNYISKVEEVTKGYKVGTIIESNKTKERYVILEKNYDIIKCKSILDENNIINVNLGTKGITDYRITQ